MMPRTKEGQELYSSASRHVIEDLSTAYANEPVVLGDLNHSEMTSFFKVMAFQIRPVLFYFRA